MKATRSKKLVWIVCVIWAATRLMIYQAIARRGQMNCSEIVSLRGVTPATVSHHLKILAEAKLIESRRSGQFVFSKPLPETMSEYLKSLARIIPGRNG